MCICTDPIRPQVADTIQNGIPPNVSAVTNTRGPGKCREGALSLEQITFKPQRGVHADGVLRHRSGPLFSLQLEPSEGNGLGVDESRCLVPFICLRMWSGVEGLITRGRCYVSPQCTADHRDLSRFSWRTCVWFWSTIPRLPGKVHAHADASASVDLHIKILAAPVVLVSCAQAASFLGFIVRQWPPTVKTKRAAC